MNKLHILVFIACLESVPTFTEMEFEQNKHNYILVKADRNTHTHTQVHAHNKHIHILIKADRNTQINTHTNILTHSAHKLPACLVVWFYISADQQLRKGPRHIPHRFGRRLAFLACGVVKVIVNSSSKLTLWIPNSRTDSAVLAWQALSSFKASPQYTAAQFSI